MNHAWRLRSAVIGFCLVVGVGRGSAAGVEQGVAPNLANAIRAIVADGRPPA